MINFLFVQIADMKYKLLYILIIVYIGSIMVACNKPVDDLLGDGYPSEDTSSVSLSSPKILYIVIDGLRGEAVKDLSPSTITSIGRNSIYTLNGLSDATGFNSVGWSDMLTGVDSAKHHVTTQNFSGNNFANYPSVFTRLKSIHPEWRTVAFCKSQALKDNLLSDATDSKVSSSDAEVSFSILDELTHNDATLVFGEFSSVDSVGAVDGYESNVPNYAAAIQAVDSYVSSALTTIKERPNYKNENWLVVIASNKGGYISYTPTPSFDVKRDFANPTSNTIVYFYNPKFVLSYYPKPSMISYEGSSVLYTGTSIAAKTPKPTNTSDIYDLGTTNEMTISFKLKVIQYGTLNPGILLKTGSSASSYRGWWFCHNGANGSIRFAVRGSATSTLTSVAGYQTVGEWHSYTGRVYIANGKRWMKLYEDGICMQNDSLDITSVDATAYNTASSVTTYYPLSVGQSGSYVSGTTQELVNDIKIYNIALPEAYIAENACKPYVSATDTYSNNLIGYWPGLTNGGATIKDYSVSGNDMTVSGSYTWTGFSEASNQVCPLPSESYFAQNPRPLDIPFQVYNWLGIYQISWGLDGKYWSTTYNTIKY